MPFICAARRGPAVYAGAPLRFTALIESAATFFGWVWRVANHDLTRPPMLNILYK
jgi:hypothetical protein